MARLRVGVVGAGAWAITSHLPNLVQRADVLNYVRMSREGEAELARAKERFGFAVASEHHGEVHAAGATCAAT